ncbi:MAG: hypothetical protein R3252_03855 [Robiginitalea sp.]|nr:hypothetical protein [Robiginitalea sp.]
MDMDQQTIKNAKERHAFCLVGEETLFLCHQIMTHMEPHSYEFILEIEIDKDIKKKLLEDRKKNGHTHYFGNREGHEFTLPSIASGNRKSFKANVWTTVPESDPPDVLPSPPWGGLWGKPAIEPWISEVEVKIKRVVHYRHLNRNENSRRFEAYVLFGRGKEAHILHSVLWQPEYDHVASLKKAPKWLDEEQLISSVMISFPKLPYDPWSTQCNCPFEDGSTHEVRYEGLTEFRDPMGKLQNKIPRLEIEVDHTWWFSTKIINYWNYQFCTDSKQIC